MYISIEFNSVYRTTYDSFVCFISERKFSRTVFKLIAIYKNHNLEFIASIVENGNIHLNNLKTAFKNTNTDKSLIDKLKN